MQLSRLTPTIDGEDGEDGEVSASTARSFTVTGKRLILSERDRDLFLSVMEHPPTLKGKLKNVTTLPSFSVRDMK